MADGSRNGQLSLLASSVLVASLLEFNSMENQMKLRSITAIALSLALTACGGGSGGSTDQEVVTTSESSNVVISDDSASLTSASDTESDPYFRFTEVLTDASDYNCTNKRAAREWLWGEPEEITSELQDNGVIIIVYWWWSQGKGASFGYIPFTSSCSYSDIFFEAITE